MLTDKEFQEQTGIDPALLSEDMERFTWFTHPWFTVKTKPVKRPPKDTPQTRRERVEKYRRMVEKGMPLFEGDDNPEPNEMEEALLDLPRDTASRVFG